MTSFKVHGSPLSTATMRVLATLKEKNLDFEFIHVNMAAGEQKEQPYISLNPFGQLPAFEDGDLKLFGKDSAIVTDHLVPYGALMSVESTEEPTDMSEVEYHRIPSDRVIKSRAISNYIAHGPSNSGTQLIPADHKKMAILAVWMEVEAHQFDPSASRLAFELGFKPLIGLPTDEAAVAECVAKLEKVLDIYETRLGESKYLGGDEFSLVDVHHQPTVHYMMGMRVKYLLESRPRVNAWCQDILARPTWAKVIEMQKICN